MCILMLFLSVVIFFVLGCGLIYCECILEEVFFMVLFGIVGKEKLDFVGEVGLRWESSGFFEN